MLSFLFMVALDSLEEMANKKNRRAIGILSGKGGVGKTVTTINLGAALTELGDAPTIIDADVSSANMTIHFGLPEKEGTLQDVLSGPMDINSTIRVVPKGLRVVPASLSIEKSIVDMSGFSKKMGKVEGLSIIDSPPGFSQDIYHIMEACDELIIVSTPDVPSITDAVKIIEIAKKMEKPILGLVITRVENDCHEISHEDIETLCEVPIIGSIPEDKKMRHAVSEKTPILFHSPYSKAAIGYRQLAANISGVEYKTPKMLLVRRLFG